MFKEMFFLLKFHGGHFDNLVPRPHKRVISLVSTIYRI